MNNENIKVWVSKMKNLLPEQVSLITTIENLNLLISVWNPVLGAIIQSVLNNTKFIHSEKLEERLSQMMESINVIQEQQKNHETNYEAALICPELFKHVLIMEDKERVKELLCLIEKLFSAGKIDFDRILEANRIINSLSDNEYKILKIFPEVLTDWKLVLSEEWLKDLKINNKIELESIIISLTNKNLIEIKTPMRSDTSYGLNLDFDDKEQKSKLTSYGYKFLMTMKNNAQELIA
jgi:hypothetical protein